MISFKKNIGIFIITFLTFNVILSPFYVNGVTNPIGSENSNYLEISSNDIKGVLSNEEIAHETSFAESGFQSNNYFDDLLLTDFLDKKYNAEIKVIILFKEGTSKSYREDIIDSVFNKYEIIYNYDIISGVYLRCDTQELLSLKENIEQISVINKIFKSKVYNLPYFNENEPSPSTLNKELNPNWWLSAIGANNLEYNGSGIRVAVIDTGIYDHPDLTIGSARNFVSNESSFEYQDDIGHGTHCAGIIGSNGAGSDGLYRGIAPGVTLINARAGDTAGLDEGDVISAIEWSVNTASVDIISMSFGDVNPVAYDPLTLALSAATDSGVMCVASAGNSGSMYISGGSPASGIDVISVGATDINNDLASFSSWGPTYTYLSYPDVVAPGVQIISTEAPNSFISDEKRFVGDFFDFALDADYIPLSGTSMACPMVVGALAILKQAYSSITPETGRIALLKGANKLLNTQDNPALKSGFGLINVSRSLEYLSYINSTKSNINDIAILGPDELPVAPFDLLNFPGDQQLYNLTVISGDNNTLDINIPDSVAGLTINLDRTQVTFDQAGIDFIGLHVIINHDAQPGFRSFTLNITSGLDLYDEINISINIRYPEYRILLDSFHGLNDWDPLTSFYQMTFYDWMKDIINMDIAIDYFAEYWTPNYDKSLNNSILTEEKLSQYDLVVLQNPILPYAPLEINNLNDYFVNGGNILFLGTRYQDMCVENINSLFTTLGVDIQINKDNLIDESWLGIGASVNPQIISEFNDSLIFNDVSNLLWDYGCKLTVTGDAKPIALKNGDSLAASYNGNANGKGKFIIFGDLSWTSLFYKSLGHYNSHKNLANNLMNYLVVPEEVSLNVLLNSPSSSSANLNISIYAKDYLSDALIDSEVLNAFLNVSIKNASFYDEIFTQSFSNGLAYNYTYVLPYTSAIPYEIDVNLTINSQTFNETIKYLYYDATEIPKITNLVSTDAVERNGIESLDIDVFLDSINYELDAYLAIYPYSYYSRAGTINKTLSLINSPPNQFKYSVSYIPISTDPAGSVIFFTIPTNPSSNYINPHSPRGISLFTNNPPQFNEDSSTIIIDNNEILTLSQTYDDESLFVFRASQGSVLQFDLNVSDSVSYEDQNSSKMIVSVNYFMAAVILGNSLAPIDPNILVHSQLSYDLNTETQKGSFTIPFQMTYSSLTGIKTISTTSTYDSTTQDGYIGLILITVFDSEGLSEDFFVVFLVQESVSFDLMIVIIIIVVVIIVGITIIIFSNIRKRKRSEVPIVPTYYFEQGQSEFEGVDSTTANVYYCPFCGERLTGLRNFCPSCGKSLNFEE